MSHFETVAENENAVVTDIDVNIDGVQFIVRVAGVCIEDQQVLLNRFVSRNFWFLPGGRCAIQETSRDTLRREMQEELSVSVDLGRLLWIDENFFELDGRPYHELALYYEMRMPAANACSDKQKVYRSVTDFGENSVFQWFRLENVSDIELMPPFLQDGLLHLPDEIQHMDHRR
ncbi:MAG: NUDIX hydrolase [Acidobacteriaceae bacterium]